jgi:hypothetical protein
MTPTSEKIMIAALSAVVAGGAGIAAAGGPGGVVDDGEPPLTGAVLERASEVALEASRAYGQGGRVTGSEGPDEEPHYEVDVTLADGTEIEFDLDESFTVVGTPEFEGAGRGTWRGRGT